MPQTPLTIRPTLLPSASDSIPSHPEENIHFDDDGGPGHRFHRDAYTGSDSDSDSGDSEATLDVIDVYQFGHPLERMCRLENTSETPMFRSRVSSPACSSVSNSSVGSSSFGDSIYEALVDRLLIQNPSFGTSDASNEFMSVPLDPAKEFVMVKCLPRDSVELRILIELNHSERRRDPWNPVPYLRAVVERNSRVFVVMERLSAYDDPPFKTVANYIDLFRQILEELTFLHQLGIAKLSSSQDPRCYMVDLSSAPSGSSSPAGFDRSRYPVKYYFTDLSLARKFDGPSSFGSPESEYRRDVQDCALNIDRLLTHIPQVAPKFKSLVKAMTVGGFGAEDSRKLFEALCKSFEPSVFDLPVFIPEPCNRCKSLCAVPRKTVIPIKQSLST